MTLGEKLDSPVAAARGRRLGFAGWFVAADDASCPRRVRWLRILWAAAALLVAMYLGAVTAVYWFVHHHRGISAVQFIDLALPWRREGFDRARGDNYIRQAQQRRAGGAFAEAYRLAKQGLSLAPRNRDGRLLLAELSLGLHQPQTARDLLLGGWMDHQNDPVFAESLLGLLLQQQEDHLVVALADRHFRHANCNPSASRVIAFAAATAAFFRGNYDQAEDFLRRLPVLSTDRAARLLRIRIERDRGFAALALLQLRQLATDFPDDSEVHREVVEHLRHLGLHGEARRCSVAFQIAHPELASPRLELLQCYHEDSDRARLTAEIEAMLRDFAEDTRVWLDLAAFGANIGDAALVRKIAAHAAERGFPTDAFDFLAAEAALVAHDYAGALGAIDEFRRRAGENSPRLLGDTLEAIAHLGLGDNAAARRCLGSVFAAPALRVDNLLVIADRLNALHATEAAHKVLARAFQIDPANQAALARLIELDLELNCVDELPAHLERFVTMRRPSPEILRVVRQKLGSDAFLFSSNAPSALKRIENLLAKSR